MTDLGVHLAPIPVFTFDRSGRSCSAGTRMWRESHLGRGPRSGDPRPRPAHRAPANARPAWYSRPAPAQPGTHRRRPPRPTQPAAPLRASRPTVLTPRPAGCPHPRTTPRPLVASPVGLRRLGRFTVQLPAAPESARNPLNRYLQTSGLRPDPRSTSLRTSEPSGSGWSPGRGRGFMHHKFAILDEKVLVTSLYN